MNDRPAAAKEKRYFSEQLNVELGYALVENGRLSRAQCDDLNSRRVLTGDTLDKILVKEGVLPERDILRALSELTAVPFREIAEFNVADGIVRKVPARVALRYKVMPVAEQGHTLVLAVNAVPTLATADGLRMVLDTPLDWVLCTKDDIEKSIKHFYGLGAETIDDLQADAPPVDDTVVESTDVSADSADAGIVRFVNQVIAEAIRMEATDIHIEPFETTVRLRYRIDGMLQTIPVPEGVHKFRRSIASCIKIMADMNIAERRKPHDGRIKVRSGKDEFDLRVSILPTSHGETVNMRILNRNAMFIDLEHLGLAQHQVPQIAYLSGLSHGVVLLTGPTGSGKTTTLYALLSRINNDDVKIITVEDPVEYQIPGINQIQTHAQIGLTFANILRSILRHDPDIVLIGEIRDTETADIAVRASLTGHLVFSTLHTNDAPSAITRLVDMGIEPFLVASCLEGVIAQRLVRRICAHCNEPTQVDESVLSEMVAMYPDRMSSATFLKGHGCPHCNFTGYRGRVALFEIMKLDDALRGMITHQRPANEIKKQAMQNGLVTLRRDGWSRVLEGTTTVEEVMRVARKAD